MINVRHRSHIAESPIRGGSTAHARVSCRAVANGDEHRGIQRDHDTDVDLSSTLSGAFCRKDLREPTPTIILRRRGRRFGQHTLTAPCTCAIRRTVADNVGVALCRWSSLGYRLSGSGLAGRGLRENPQPRMRYQEVVPPGLDWEAFATARTSSHLIFWHSLVASANGGYFAAHKTRAERQGSSPDRHCGSTGSETHEIPSIARPCRHPPS